MQLRRILELHTHFFKEIDILHGTIEREGHDRAGGVRSSGRGTVEREGYGRVGGERSSGRVVGRAVVTVYLSGTCAAHWSQESCVGEVFVSLENAFSKQYGEWL